MGKNDSSTVVMCTVHTTLHISAVTVIKTLHSSFPPSSSVSLTKCLKFQALASVVSVQTFHTIHMMYSVRIFILYRMNLSSKAVDPHKHACYKVTPRTHTFFIACGTFLPFLSPL